MDLNSYISLFIPTKDAEGRDLVRWKRNQVLKVVEFFFLEQFGYFTEYDVRGVGKMENISVIEDITIVQAFYEGEDNAVLVKVGELAAMVKKKLNQDAVTIEQNGGISFA